jgi:hypothetical protein
MKQFMTTEILKKFKKEIRVEIILHFISQSSKKAEGLRMGRLTITDPLLNHILEK